MQTSVVYLAFVLATVGAIDLHVPAEQRDSMRAEGAKHLRSMQRDAMATTSDAAHQPLPLFSQCWRSALDQLNGTCAQLTDRSQAALAMHFARCFMQMTHGTTTTSTTTRTNSLRRQRWQHNKDTAAGDDDQLQLQRSSADGENGETVSDDSQDADDDVWCSRPDDHACMRRLPDRHFAAFTQFFAHTAHICYYVWGQRWQLAAAEQLERSQRATALVAERMAEAGRVQHTLLAAQREAMRAQREAAARAERLGRVLREGGAEVRRLGGEWRRVAGEQGRVLEAVFGRLHELHGWLLRSGAAVHSALFWLPATLGALLAVVVLLPARCQSMRWLCGAVCVLGWWLEQGWLRSLGLFDSVLAAEWWWRRAVLALCVAVCVRSALRSGGGDDVQRLERLCERLRAQQTELVQELRAGRHHGGKEQRSPMPTTTPTRSMALNGGQTRPNTHRIVSDDGDGSHRKLAVDFEADVRGQRDAAPRTRLQLRQLDRKL